MPIHNQEVADIFNEVAELLAIQKANPFRIRAYQKAANVLGNLPSSVAEMLKAGADLTELPGIGEDLAGKIKEIVGTGHLKKLEELRKITPPEITQLLKIPSLGPRRVQKLYQELHIQNVEDLRKAIEEKRLQALAGFGEKTEKNILEELKRSSKNEKRFLWYRAAQIIEPLLAYLRQDKKVDQLLVAGSFRRHKETVGDIDLLAMSRQAQEILDRFVNYEEVRQILSQGETRSSVVLRAGLQADLRVVAPESYGAALLYLTGSKAHNISLRKLAQAQHLKINEYGVFQGNRCLVSQSEEEIYQFFNLKFIPPELREDRGEIEAARSNNLPELIHLQDIRGDLHVHTQASDGQNTLEEMVHAAQEKGYEYVAITDHSKYVGITHGLDVKRLTQQIKAIDKLNAKLKGITVLKGIEVDILKEGSLALPHTILKELDLTVCSIHTHFNLSEEKQTERILRAIDNPYLKILGHPTGRLLEERRPYAVNLEKVMKAAQKRGAILELNAQPQRMDLEASCCQRAKELGLRVVISTDAHACNNFDFMSLGIAQARRGWLEKKDVINACSLTELRKILGC
ncbi:MAG: DNA polymerase/3'-5' exonuclease PolX [Deltaproteobacteria bacterium]|nr:DNA polymerase/3'-5' exonuclease PolX [Deltaproteobacteria bacterium]